MKLTTLEEEGLKRFRELGALFIEHPKFTHAYRKAHTAVILAPCRREAPCIQLSGPPGVGKTTIREKLVAEFPADDAPRWVKLPRQPAIRCRHTPLLSFEMPTRPTVKSLARAALKRMGADDWDCIDTDLLTDRLDRYVAAAETQAILIDDSHRAVDRAGVVTAANIAEWLIGRHSANRVCLILFGLGRLKNLFIADLQLARRWDAQLRLEPYRWIGRSGQPSPDQDVFIAVLRAFASHSPMPFTSDVGIDTDEGAYRFIYASRGAIGLLKSILSQAIRIMIEEEQWAPISLSLLERAYEEGIESELKAPANPFSSAFKLDLRMEPPPLRDDRLMIRPPAERRRDRNRRARNDELTAALRV